LGWAQVLLSTELDTSRRQRAYETVFRNATAMTKLIDDLLDTSRAISSKLSLHVQDLDLKQVVQAAVESVRPLAAGQSINLVTRFAPEQVWVSGDATRLQQIAWNLLSNAIKFSSPGGSVEAALDVVDGMAQLQVKDFGSGISREFLPYVFEPFLQQDSGSARTHGGMGLGLAISRQLVNLHGGRITAHSQGAGEGATFSVLLPLRQPKLPAAPPSDVSVSRSAPRATGIRVLLVDDDDDARELLASILEEHGYLVRAARNVSEAMKQFSEQPPDVLLSDIAMPGEDGYALIRRVRTLAPEQGGQVPAVAITAYTRATERTRIFDAGYTAHLAKPINPTKLVNLIASLGREPVAEQ
jgi:CheY-like chemotaxis protein